MNRIFFALSFLFTTSLAAVAQDTLRIGYIDFELTLSEMDGYAHAESVVDELAANYETEYARMETEYNDKVKDYVQNSKTLSEPIKLARQAEITECEDRMDLFKQRYTSDIARQREALLQPLRDTLKAAIRSVAEAQRIALVLDGRTPLYVSGVCIDMTDAVKMLLKSSEK